MRDPGLYIARPPEEDIVKESQLRVGFWKAPELQLCKAGMSQVNIYSRVKEQKYELVAFAPMPGPRWNQEGIREAEKMLLQRIQQLSGPGLKLSHPGAREQFSATPAQIKSVIVDPVFS